MNFRGAIFDMDGTLLDSMPAWDNVGADYLRSRGLEPAPDFRQAILPLTLPQVAAYMIENYGLHDKDVPTLVWEINQLLADYYRQEAPLKEGVTAFLARLKDAGVRMCVATATDRPLVEAALARVGILELFDFILTVAEAGAGKDQPDIFLQARERLGTELAETVVFEDALHAVRTAQAAGFRVVALYDAASSRHRAEIEALSERYLNSLAEWGEDA